MIYSGIDTYLFFYLPVFFAISVSALAALGPKAIVCIMVPFFISSRLQLLMSSVASPSVRKMISSPNASPLSVESTWWLEKREHLPRLNYIYTSHIINIKLTIKISPVSLDWGLYTCLLIHLVYLASIWRVSLVWTCCQ